MNKPNPFAKAELKMARQLAEEFAEYYRKRPNLRPPANGRLPMDASDAIRNRFGTVTSEAEAEYRNRFSSLLGA